MTTTPAWEVAYRKWLAGKERDLIPEKDVWRAAWEAAGGKR